MPITREDIQKISRELMRASVKDSEFKELSSVPEDSSVVIVENRDGAQKSNKRISMPSLTDHVSSKLNLAKVPYSVEGYDFKNLAEFLGIVISKIGGDVQPPVLPDASNVGYTVTLGAVTITNVKLALDHIIRILYGINDTPFPTSADTADISSLFVTQ